LFYINNALIFVAQNQCIMQNQYQSQAAFQAELQTATEAAMKKVLPALFAERARPYFFSFFFNYKNVRYYACLYADNTISVKTSLYGHCLLTFINPFDEYRCQDAMYWDGDLEPDFLPNQIS